MLLVGSSLSCHLSLVEVGLLWCHEKRSFLRPAWENEWYLFVWNQTPEFPRSPLPPGHHGRSPAVSSTVLMVLPQIFIPYVYSPVQHWASLVCVPAAVHCVWDHMASRATWLWREHRWMQGSRSKTRGTRERIPLFVDFLCLHWLHPL